MIEQEILAKWTPAALDNYRVMTRDQKLELAKRMSFAEKMYLGPMLFDRECEIVKRQIRGTFPQMPEATLNAVLREYVRRRYGDD